MEEVSFPVLVSPAKEKEKGHVLAGKLINQSNNKSLIETWPCSHTSELSYLVKLHNLRIKVKYRNIGKKNTHSSIYLMQAHTKSESKKGRHIRK